MKGIHENNFWTENLEISMIKEFDDLYSADTSKNKEKSSKIMWAIYFAYNPNSKLYNLPDKLKVIARDHLKDPKFKWSSVAKQVEVYKELVLTDAERALLKWNEIMIMRDQTIKDLYKSAIADRDVDTLVKIDKMMTTTPKMFEDYKKVKKDFEEEKTTKKGKKINSLSEEDEI